MYQQRYKKVYKIKKTFFSLKTLRFIWMVLKQRVAYAVCEHNAKFPDLIFHVNGGNPKKKKKKIQICPLLRKNI